MPAIDELEVRPVVGLLRHHHAVGLLLADDDDDLLVLERLAAGRGEVGGDAALARGGFGLGLRGARILLELEALRGGGAGEGEADRGKRGAAQRGAVHRDGGSRLHGCRDSGRAPRARTIDRRS